MFAALYILAASMVVAGAWAVFAGWEILLLERGWSMLIAGGTLATGGLVLAAITTLAGALFRRIETLTEAVRSGQRTQAQALMPRRPSAPESPLPPIAVTPAPACEIAPEVPHDRTTSDTAAAALGAATGAGVGLGVGREAQPQTTDAREPPPIEPDVAAPPIDLSKAPPPLESDPATDAGEREAPSGTEPGAAVAARTETEDPLPAPRDDAGLSQDAEAFPERAEPEDEPREDERADAPSEPGADDAPVAEPGDRFDDSAREADETRVDETDAEEILVEPADAPRAEEAPIGTDVEADAEGDTAPGAPVVVGTHMSGANRYTMYSDGSIEAETPDGRFVFGSLEEFRGFIASAGEDPSGTSQTGPR